MFHDQRKNEYELFQQLVQHTAEFNECDGNDLKF